MVGDEYGQLVVVGSELGQLEKAAVGGYRAVLGGQLQREMMVVGAWLEGSAGRSVNSAWDDGGGGLEGRQATCSAEK